MLFAKLAIFISKAHVIYIINWGKILWMQITHLKKKKKQTMKVVKFHKYKGKGLQERIWYKLKSVCHEGCVKLTLKVPITIAADNIHKYMYFFIVLQRK